MSLVAVVVLITHPGVMNGIVPVAAQLGVTNFCTFVALISGLMKDHATADASDVAKIVAPPGLVKVVVTCLLIPGLMSCASLTAFNTKVEADATSFWKANGPAIEANATSIAENLVTSFLVASVENLAGGDKFDASWAITTGINSVSGSLPLDNQRAATMIANSIVKSTDDNSFRPVAQSIAQQFVVANPQTPSQQVAVAAALAKGASMGVVSAGDSLP